MPGACRAQQCANLVRNIADQRQQLWHPGACRSHGDTEPRPHWRRPPLRTPKSAWYGSRSAEHQVWTQRSLAEQPADASASRRPRLRTAAAHDHRRHLPRGLGASDEHQRPPVVDLVIHGVRLVPCAGNAVQIRRPGGRCKADEIGMQVACRPGERACQSQGQPTAHL